MNLLIPIVFAALSSSDAIVTILNSPSASGVARYDEAKRVLERDAAAGAPVQQFLLAVAVNDGKSRDEYLSSSRGKIVKMAHERNNPLAWYLLSLENNDLKMLHRAAQGGNVQALNALGTIAIQETLRSSQMPSNLVEKVLSRSFDYFRQAAEKRDPNAFINLGSCYMRGIGCRQDPVLAFASFESAARAGHPEGMDYLSAAYQNGHGVKKDENLSLFWRMKAAALRGDKNAVKWLKERK